MPQYLYSPCVFHCCTAQEAHNRDERGPIGGDMTPPPTQDLLSYHHKYSESGFSRSHMPWSSVGSLSVRDFPADATHDQTSAIRDAFEHSYRTHGIFINSYILSLQNLVLCSVRMVAGVLAGAPRQRAMSMNNANCFQMLKCSLLLPNLGATL